VVSVLLAHESKALLIGERASLRIARTAHVEAGATHGVAHANGVATIHLAPDQVIVTANLDFANERTVADIGHGVADYERRLRAAHPEVAAVFVKPQAAREFARHRAAGDTIITPDALMDRIAPL
jgi:divalent metal cation (Fe/Co/Zn/Cd) transporter